MAYQDVPGVENADIATGYAVFMRFMSMEYLGLDGARMNDSVVVKVKPGSRKGPLVEVGPDGELTTYVRERAVDGKANDAVTRLLAAHLQLPRSGVELVSGTTSRLKRFRVSR